MAVSGVGFIGGFLLMFFSISGMGLPLGMPPGEWDPKIEKAAPDECLAYFSWAAMATPDSESKNSYERFLAQDETQNFIEQIDLLAGRLLTKNFRDKAALRAVGEQLPVVGKAILTRPGAIALNRVTPSIDGKGPPVSEATLIVSLGDQAKAVRDSVEKINLALGEMAADKTIGGSPWKQLGGPTDPVFIWGFHDDYLIAGVSEISISNLLARLKTAEPAWLIAAKKRATVERRATLLYLDVKGIHDLGARFTGERWREVAAALGASDADSITSVTGFDGADCIARTQIVFDGEPKGLLGAALGKPLERSDLKPIPADASFAFAARFDADALLEELRTTLSAIDTGARAEWDKAIEELKAKGEIDLEKEILEPLGDRWRLFNSPGEGGLIFTGTTLVVSVDDAATLRETAAKLQRVVQGNAPVGDPNETRRPRHLTIGDFEHAGQKAYFLKSIGEFAPFAVAWVITDDELIISLFPSGIKAYLSRDPATATLDKSPFAESLFEHGATSAIGYQNPRGLFQLAYPIVQYVLHFLASEAQREGVNFDISMLPSAPSIARHLEPGTTALHRTDYGAEVVQRQSTPVSGLLLTPLVIVAPMFGIMF